MKGSHTASSMAGTCAAPIIVDFGGVAGIHQWGSQPCNGFIPIEVVMSVF